MDVKIILTICVIFLNKYADAAITHWAAAGDGIANTAGATLTGVTFTTQVNENGGSGTTTGIVVTATAGGTATISDYTIVTNPVDVFTMSGTTGNILYGTANIDRENIPSVTATITATDSTSATGTLTVGSNIGDVNDVSPAHPDGANVHTNVQSGSCSAFVVGTFAFTDGDATTVNQVSTYALGGTHISKFLFNTNTAELKVAIGTTLRFEDAASYVLTITATNTASPNLSGTATLTVHVCSAPTIAVSLLTLLIALLVSMR